MRSSTGMFFGSALSQFTDDQTLFARNCIMKGEYLIGILLCYNCKFLYLIILKYCAVHFYTYCLQHIPMSNTVS